MKKADELEKMLTSQEVMEILQISRQALYRYIRMGELRAYKIGKSLKFRQSDLREFVESRVRKTV